MEERIFRKQPYSWLFLFVVTIASPFVFAMLVYIPYKIVQLFCYQSDNIVFVIVLSVVSLIITIAYLFQMWTVGLTKIIVTQQSLTIRSIFKQRKFFWNQIKDYGKVERIVSSRGLIERSYDFYIVAGDGKRIFIVNSQVVGAEDLYEIIHKNTINA